MLEIESEKHVIRYGLIMSAVMTLCLMTHYYLMGYTLMICFFIFVWLCKKKRWKTIIAGAISLMFGFGLLTLFDPYWVDNLTVGKGYSGLHNLKHFMEMWPRVPEGLLIVGKTLAFNRKYWIAYDIALLLVIVLSVILKAFEKKNIYCIVLVFLSAVFYTIGVSLVTPTIEARYFFLPIVLIWNVGMICLMGILKKCQISNKETHKKLFYLVIVAVIAFFCVSNSSYIPVKSSEDFVSEWKNTPWMLWSPGGLMWKDYCMVMDLIEVDELTIIGEPLDDYSVSLPGRDFIVCLRQDDLESFENCLKENDIQYSMVEMSTIMYSKIYKISVDN